MFIGRKTTFRPDQDGGGGKRGRKARKGWVAPGLAFIRPVKGARGGPVCQHPFKRLQVGHLGNKGRAALFGGLQRMGLQAVLADAFGIGVAGLHRQDARRTQFHGLFNDEIGAGLFDRREQQPQVGRHMLGRTLRLGQGKAAALSCLGDPRQPFAVAPVEQGDCGPPLQPHHRKEVMRLLWPQSHGLPRSQRLIYKESDFCPFHESEPMTEPQQLPEGADRKAAAGEVADAAPGNWVDRYAPAGARPYLRLSRADRPIGTWLLLIPCLWGIALAAMADGFRAWDIWLALSCGAGAFLMRGAGCTWNDYTDRDIDAAVARTRSRPLPSGQVTPRAALVWMAAQAAVAAVILFSYNALAIALGVASLVLVIIYPFAKRFTWWPQVFLGLAFNWGALLAYAAHAGEVRVPSVLLYLSGILWTLYYDTIYAHQDREDDALIGVKSTARLFADQSRRWLFGFIVATVTLMALAVILSPQRGVAQMGVALAGVWLFGAHMLWQMRRLDLDDAASCRQIFWANRNAGLIPALFLAAAAFL